MLGVVAEDLGDFDRAFELLTDAAASSARAGDRRGKAFALLHLGMVAYGQADFPGATAYCEQGIALARELGSRHITSNVPACGPFPTKMMKAVLETSGDVIAAEVPVGRIGKPGDVAGACVFLASEAG